MDRRRDTQHGKEHSSDSEGDGPGDWVSSQEVGTIITLTPPMEHLDDILSEPITDLALKISHAPNSMIGRVADLAIHRYRIQSSGLATIMEQAHIRNKAELLQLLGNDAQELAKATNENSITAHFQSTTEFTTTITNCGYGNIAPLQFYWTTLPEEDSERLKTQIKNRAPPTKMLTVLQPGIDLNFARRKLLGTITAGSDLNMAALEYFLLRKTLKEELDKHLPTGVNKSDISLYIDYRERRHFRQNRNTFVIYLLTPNLPQLNRIIKSAYFALVHNEEGGTSEITIGNQTFIFNSKDKGGHTPKGLIVPASHSYLELTSEIVCLPISTIRESLYTIIELRENLGTIGYSQKPGAILHDSTDEITTALFIYPNTAGAAFYLQNPDNATAIQAALDLEQIPTFYAHHPRTRSARPSLQRPSSPMKTSSNIYHERPQSPVKTYREAASNELTSSALPTALTKLMKHHIDGILKPIQEDLTIIKERQDYLTAEQQAQSDSIQILYDKDASTSSKLDANTTKLDIIIQMMEEQGRAGQQAKVRRTQQKEGVSSQSVAAPPGNGGGNP